MESSSSSSSSSYTTKKCTTCGHPLSVVLIVIAVILIVGFIILLVTIPFWMPKGPTPTNVGNQQQLSDEQISQLLARQKLAEQIASAPEYRPLSFAPPPGANGLPVSSLVYDPSTIFSTNPNLMLDRRPFWNSFDYGWHSIGYVCQLVDCKKKKQEKPDNCACNEKGICRCSLAEQYRQDYDMDGCCNNRQLVLWGRRLWNQSNTWEYMVTNENRPGIRMPVLVPNGTKELYSGQQIRVANQPGLWKVILYNNTGGFDVYCDNCHL